MRRRRVAKRQRFVVVVNGRLAWVAHRTWHFTFYVAFLCVTSGLAMHAEFRQWRFAAVERGLSRMAR